MTTTTDSVRVAARVAAEDLQALAGELAALLRGDEALPPAAIAAALVAAHKLGNRLRTHLDRLQSARGNRVAGN